MCVTQDARKSRASRLKKSPSVVITTCVVCIGIRLLPDATVDVVIYPVVCPPCPAAFSFLSSQFKSHLLGYLGTPSPLPLSAASSNIALMRARFLWYSCSASLAFASSIRRPIINQSTSPGLSNEGARPSRRTMASQQSWKQVGGCMIGIMGISSG